MPGTIPVTVSDFNFFVLDFQLLRGPFKTNLFPERIRMNRKTSFKKPLKKKTKNCFSDRLSLNAGQKYCRMLQWEHSAILSTFIKLPFVIKAFVLSIFEHLAA